MARYVLFPGYVRSKTDGDLHFIDARQLARLYGLRLHAPDTRDGLYEKDIIWVSRRNQEHFRELPGDVILRPRSSGNYVNLGEPR